MPSSQQQTRRRFASLYADRNQDPARGNIQSINQLFGVNGTNDSEPSHIRSRVSSASLQGPGVASILQLTDGSNGRLQRIFHPLIYQPGLVSTGSQYENQLIGIDGDLMGDNMAYSAVLMANDIFHKTKTCLTYKPQHMASFFASNTSATGVGPFTTETDELEKVQSRNSTWQPHELGDKMDPPGGLTASYFWREIYPWIVSEGKEAEYDYLIRYFQLAATLESVGGRSVVERNAPPPIGRDTGVNDVITTQILDRLFPKPSSSGYSADGLKEVAREIGKMTHLQQEREEAAEEARKKKEANKHSLAKQLNKQALRRMMQYNGVKTEEELINLGIPFIKECVSLESSKDSEVLEALQAAMDTVYTEEGVQEVDQTPVTPMMFKAALNPWERIDPDNLSSGVGSNAFLHGPRDKKKAAAAVEHFRAAFYSTFAPPANILKELHSGEVLLPTLTDVGHTLRNMKRFMKTLLRPNHPFIESLEKFLNKWVEAERVFTLNALADNDPARGILLLEALNMIMSEYWQKQKRADGDLIAGFDGLQIFDAIDGKRQWTPVLSASYKREMKLELFEGVYGGHKVITDGDTATVVVASTATASASGGAPKSGEDDSNRTTSGKGDNMDTNDKHNASLFGRYKRRKDPATGREYGAKAVRNKCTTPLPLSKTGYVWKDKQGQTHKGRMCLAYHVKGMCNLSCPCKEDHVEYSEEEYKDLTKWCEECYPGSDE